MTVPQVSRVPLSQTSAGPLVLLGPSLGTSASALWSSCAQRLGSHCHLVGWDLPGHGSNRSVGEGFTMAELAAAVLSLADEVLTERGEAGGSFGYAGDSVGGAVGLQLLLDAPGRVTAAALLCTGARIGEPSTWVERAATVRSSGTSALLEGTPGRWFAPGFGARQPAVSAALLAALADADDEGYAQVCDALATFDVRDRLGDIRAPVLAIAGAHDAVTPVTAPAQLAGRIPDASLVVIEHAAHLAPAEQPEQVAALLLALFHRPLLPEPSPYDAGLAVRREVLGDAHVDRAMAAATDFTRDFQELITSYAWGTIWTRPGLDRRSRSLITLTALVARGHHEELAMHVCAARSNGLTNDEIKELLLQTAIYCGVPDANTAFRIAAQVLAELDSEMLATATDPNPSAPQRESP